MHNNKTIVKAFIKKCRGAYTLEKKLELMVHKPKEIRAKKWTWLFINLLLH